MSAVRRPWLNGGFGLRSSAAVVVFFAATHLTATELDDPTRLHELAESLEHPAWQLALRERAYRVTSESDQTAAVRALFAQRWLGQLLELGLADQALSAWESLPSPFRDQTLNPVGRVDDGLERQSVTDDYADLRMELAAACILEGRLDLARQLVAEVATELATTSTSTDDADAKDRHTVSLFEGAQWKPPEFDDDAARLAILRWHLEPSEADPFSLLVGVMAMKFDRGPWFRLGTWERLFALLAARGGYPSLARYIRRSAKWNLDDEWWHLREVPDVVKTAELTVAASRAEDSINRLRSLLERQSRSSPAAAPATSVDEAIRRLIAAPSIIQLRERPLPTGVDPIAMTYEQERDHRQTLRREHELPFRHEIVRVDARGDSVVAIGASQDYDPVGELSRGAYWVFRSHDGGARWEPPLYTGLRITMPYVVRPRSDLPMIRRSGVRLEVEVRELDLDHIMFPPILTRTKREALGLYLDLPWTLLERDSDGDGLTDLAEERLLTDPRQADTDADGLDDAIDPLPQVPHVAEIDDRAALMQAILDNTLSGMRAVIHEVGDLEPGADPGQVVRRHRNATLAGERTAFLIGDRASLGGTTTARRIIVLSSEEHAAAKEKFGPIFATRYDVLMTNRAGNLAFVIWSAQWRGGEGIVEKVDGKWEFSVFSSWIS